jgi:hypothetical protein
MPDNGWSRSVRDQSVVHRLSGGISAAGRPDHISQAECLRDLGLAVVGMLTVALLANLLVLSM